VAQFDSLMGNEIDEAYRLVNGQDAVTRMPRTVNALAFGSIGYNHCGPTALIMDPKAANDKSDPLVWVEGESDDKACPVRDGVAMISPLGSGSLLGDLLSVVDDSDDEPKNTKKLMDYLKDANKVGNAMKERLETFTAADLSSIVGIDKSFAERETKIIQSILSGEALSHHMEDEYYLAMGRASGFATFVGEEIKEL